MHTTNLFRNSTDFKSFSSGQTIFQRGDIGDAMYVVKEGEVSLSIQDREVGVLGPGEIFGEMALVEQKPRSATATAKTDCQVVPVTPQRFSFLVQQTPNFALLLLKVMADRLRKTSENVA